MPEIGEHVGKNAVITAPNPFKTHVQKCPKCGLRMVLVGCSVFTDAPTRLEPSVTVSYRCINTSVCETTMSYTTKVIPVEVKMWLQTL